MSAPNLQQDVQKKLQELLRLTNKVLPVKAGKAVRDSVRENFRKGGFNVTVWSTFRTHRMQNDLASKLLDENGQLKKFDKWVEDISGIVSVD